AAIARKQVGLVVLGTFALLDTKDFDDCIGQPIRAYRQRRSSYGKAESANDVISAVDLIEHECEDGSAFVRNWFFEFEAGFVRIALLWMDAPRSGWILINGLFDGPILLIEVGGRILEHDVGCGGRV